MYDTVYYCRKQHVPDICYTNIQQTNAQTNANLVVRRLGAPAKTCNRLVVVVVFVSNDEIVVIINDDKLIL